MSFFFLYNLLKILLHNFDLNLYSYYYSKPANQELLIHLMTTCDEEKMKALLLLKKYHDQMVEVNRVSDIIKKYKLYFTEQQPLMDQLIELHSNNNNFVTEVVVKDGKIQENMDAEEEKCELKESSVINRKAHIKPEVKDETIDLDSIKITVSDLIIKNNYYLDFSKQQRSKKLINDIKQEYTKLLTNSINELIKIKRDIEAL